MTLNSLTKVTDKKKRRVGRGHGTGRVKTSGRGTKGMKSRGSVPLTYEGGALPLIKRLPFLRGKGKNSSRSIKPVIIQVSDLNSLPKDTVVDLKSLIKYKLVKEDEATRRGVKILGDGSLSVPLTVNIPVSQNAKMKIENAKGTIGNA